MAIKSFQARLVCTSPSAREYLELTHKVFNEHLAPVLTILYAARRGKYGPKFKHILSTVKNAQAAKEQVEAITSLKSKPGSGGKGDWKVVAQSLLAEKKILFDREELLPGLGSEFRRKIFEMAFQIILSHSAKLAQWRQDHRQWLAAKEAWEAANPDYMRIRPAIEVFTAAEGTAAKRRGRWHRWLAFLSSNPELAAWRGEPPIVVPLTKEERDEARQRRRHAVKNTFEKFFAKNPELKELDRVHGTYERTYVRRFAKRRNPDGFTHPPTLTLPSAVGHPAWFSFKKDATYRRLDLSRQTVELKVLQSSDPTEGSSQGFVTYSFRPDARLRRFRPVSEKTLSGRVKCDLVYHGDDGLPPRPAVIQGIKLVLKQGQPYLYLTAYVQDAPSRLSVRQANIDKYSFKWARTKILAEAPTPPLRVMAIDLGIRHIAAATILEGDTLVATRFVHNRPVSPATGRRIDGIATLDQIAAMKRELQRRVRGRGRPVVGQTSCRRLRAHINKMSEDRFKKCAAAVIDLARAHRVDLVVMENLEGLIPDAERERGINRALIRWNRGNLAKWIKMLGEEYGLRTIEVPPYWTSHVCHRCDHIGQRYTLSGGIMAMEPVGKLFGCPACGLRCNADYNASLNLHRVFRDTFPNVRKQGEAVLWKGEKVDLKAVKAAWADRFAHENSPF
ncbi:MAG: zinc ribbon domain-containing protein [Pirellulales bacterium]